MLKKKIFGVFSILVLLVSLSGCATARKQKDLQIQELRGQISVLETQIQSKDREISALRESLGKSTEEKYGLEKETRKKKVISEVKSRPKIKQVQIALKNAGYSPGSLDGRMGRQTKDAIRAFQRANGLLVDGRVGKRTWGLLKEYLYKKVK